MSLVAADEYAGISGLCADGRWEMALDSLNSIVLLRIDCRRARPLAFCLSLPTGVRAAIFEPIILRGTAPCFGLA